MDRKRVLYAENNRDHLDGRSEFLENEGYQVIRAYSPEEAEKALDQQNIHLAILDIRLVDDNDQGDISGILLARDERYKRVPKIFVTGFPTFEAVREAVGPIIGGEQIAIGFLAKREGPDALIEAVNSAFEKVVGINRNLQITWDEMNMLSFPNFSLLLESELEPELFAARSGELEDLFRKIFTEEELISITRLVWLKNNCGCLTLFAQKEDSSRQVVLVFGTWEMVQKENALIKEYLEVESTLSIKPIYAESMHYAAFAWTIPDIVDTDSLQPGPIFFEIAADKLVRTALENFYQHTLSKWHQHDSLAINSADLAALYRDRLDIKLQPDLLRLARLGIQALGERALSQSLLKEIFVDGGEMGFILPGGQTYRGPDPIAALFDPLTFRKQAAIVASSFGGITSRSLLIDREGHVYPTDFIDLRRSPILEDFVSMECEFHFDRISTTNLFSLLDFEKQISEIRTLTAIPHGISVEPECRKAWGATQIIRKLAAELVGEEFESYLIGLFHYIMKALLVYDPQNGLAKYQTSRLVHRLIAASILIAQINHLEDEKEESEVEPEKATGLEIDLNSHRVSVDGKEIHLTQTEYKLLSYLYEHHNQLCKREDILSNVFEIHDQPTSSDKSLLNTHIDRLRGKMDLNPGKHRYVVNIRGEGYRLDLDS